MTQKDGKIFMAQNLPFDKPILIIYFSPDCEECQKLTSDILKHSDEFSGVSIAMVTYLPVEYLAPFITKFNLGNYPNIYVGTEGSSFFLRYYYNVSGFPFMALYDKNGNLIKTWSQVHDISDLRKQVRNL